jgi:cell division protein ZapB
MVFKSVSPGRNPAAANQRKKETPWPYASTAAARGISADVRGRSPGSWDRAHRLPAKNSQWLCDAPARIYRCGGSRGIGARMGMRAAPLSRFTRRRERFAGHLGRLRDINRRRVAAAHRTLSPTFESTLRLMGYALTQQDFSHYSLAMNAAMVPELEALEEKIRQAAALCVRLREENRGLRAKLATLEGDRRELEEKIDDARTRLENLLKQIPE